MTGIPKVRKALLPASVILFSGLCWYLSTGLIGDFFFLLWLAPLPVLLISFRYSAKATFFISFFSYLIGRLSWLSYLITVATFIPAIIFTIALPLAFAAIITLSRQIIIRINSWYTVFIFPVLYTLFEWLLIRLSSDGSAASIAYSQSDFPFIIQIASITGLLGITFIVTFIPSALASFWNYRFKKRQLLPVAVISSLIIASVFAFGVLRLSMKNETPYITAGLVVLDEESHKMGNRLDHGFELQHTADYSSEIDSLAAKGAEIVVLPERAISIDSEIDSASFRILRNSAKQNQITIIAGYTNYRAEDRNSAIAIDKNGDLVLDYNKVHLVRGFEDHFIAGNKAGLFNLNGLHAGLAICKDLDFPGTIRQYGKGDAAVLFIPAWDFIVDDWMHSRMAVLRGVENGFSEVRVARQGRLTISDPYGRVTSEASCLNGKMAALTGDVSLKRIETFYTNHGDWFGIVILFTTVLFIVLSFLKGNKQQT